MDVNEIIDRARSSNIKYKPAKQIDRISINFNLVHEPMGEQPLSIPITASFNLDTTGQHWFRKLKVGETEQELVFSWPDAAGIFIIHNLANGKALVRPTEEEAREVQEMIVEVRRGDVIDIVRPNMPMLFEPQQSSNIFIRCKRGEAKVSFYVLPK